MLHRPSHVLNLRNSRSQGIHRDNFITSLQTNAIIKLSYRKALQFAPRRVFLAIVDATRSRAGVTSHRQPTSPSPLSPSLHSSFSTPCPRLYGLSALSPACHPLQSQTQRLRRSSLALSQTGLRHTEHGTLVAQRDRNSLEVATFPIHLYHELNEASIFCLKLPDAPC